MVTCKLYGRIGNQCFQLATTIAHSLRNGTNFKIPAFSLNTAIWPTYIKGLPTLTEDDRIESHYNEKGHEYQQMPFSENMCLNGYFQSEKYFIDYRGEVIKALGFKYKMNQGVISIHVRRGDYLQLQTKHPICTVDYYKEAIQYFTDKGYKKFLVFSDDIEWCKTAFTKDMSVLCEFEFSENNGPFADMERMSHCEHQIIANSSFSWWGAWLNRNPNKIIIAPKVWFGPDNSHLNTKDLIPESWIRI